MITQPTPLLVTLVGFGAIGQAIHKRLNNHPTIKIQTVVVTAPEVAAVQTILGADIAVTSNVPFAAKLIVECAGHSAIHEHVITALERGVECAMLSIGALSERGLPEKLEAAARKGNTQLHLLSGAIGGIDAIAAAKTEGLDEVVYIGRKPPASWRGSEAESRINLDAISQATVFFEGSAREAAELFPKNSNVAATLALAGLGMDHTKARLIADPTISENIHDVEVKGAFGQMTLSMRGKPLADNPKTSALTVMSALRFLHNKVSHITL
jgi:aspartate dehydrogenase